MWHHPWLEKHINDRPKPLSNPAPSLFNKLGWARVEPTCGGFHFPTIRSTSSGETGNSCFHKNGQGRELCTLRFCTRLCTTWRNSTGHDVASAMVVAKENLPPLLPLHRLCAEPVQVFDWILTLRCLWCGLVKLTTPIACMGLEGATGSRK